MGASTGLALALALGAAGVRVLPWVFDATVPWGVVQPFARALAVVATEAALLVGWPLGWGLAAARFVDRGEGRVFALLGESPHTTALRLLPQGLLYAAILATVSFLGGRDARAPGRVVEDLLVEGRHACADVRAPSALTVPFLDAAWLCRPGTAPRLLAQAPVGGALVSAADARISDDFRRVDLDDARFDLGPPLAPTSATAPSSPGASPRATPTRAVRVHIAHLGLSGLPPWARASVLPPVARACLVALAGLASALFGAYLVLFRRVRAAILAVVYGASGPLAALGALRLLERVPRAGPWWFVAVPIAPLAALLLVDALRSVGQALRERARLPPRGPAAS